MSEIQVTVNSRSVERFFFIIIILGLAVMNVLQWTGGDDNATAMVTDDAKLDAVEPTPASDDDTTTTCDDGIRNQGELGVDCDGPCSGYWYNGECNSEPEQNDNSGADIECRLNSDCDPGFKCDANKCVEIPPECEADDDCEYNEDCKAGKCEEKRLSGSIDVKFLLVEIGDGTGENTKKLKSVKLSIYNGKSQSAVMYGKAFVYDSRSDPMYNVAQGGTFEIGSVKSGETIEKFFTIGGVSFPDDDETRHVRVEIYDDNDEELDTVQYDNAYP